MKGNSKRCTWNHPICSLDMSFVKTEMFFMNTFLYWLADWIEYQQYLYNKLKICPTSVLQKTLSSSVVIHLNILRLVRLSVEQTLSDFYFECQILVFNLDRDQIGSSAPFRHKFQRENCAQKVQNKAWKSLFEAIDIKLRTSKLIHHSRGGWFNLKNKVLS